MGERVKYIDNLRWMTVFLLIPYHAAMAYNTWGEANYIFFGEVKPAAAVVSLISPWFMPLMFLLAGVSARFSLRKRSMGRFIQERFLRLGVPFVFGICVLAPVLSYVADAFHNAYSGGYFEHYTVFFTRFTDLTGYDGGFTLGHFWFLGVLIIIAVVSCGITALTDRVPEDKRRRLGTAGGLLLAAGAAAAFDVKLFGKQIVTYLCLYLLGYYFFSDSGFVSRLAEYRLLCGLLFIGFSAANVILFIFIGGNETLNTVCCRCAFAFGIPAIMGFGQRRLDRTGRFVGFAAGISYVFYIVHYIPVVLCQYLLWSAGAGRMLNLLLTVLISFTVTIGCCYLISKLRYVRVLFGLKK